MLLVACILAALGGAMLVLGPLGARFGMWPFAVGFALMGGAIVDALAAIVVGVIAGVRTHQWGVALAVIAVAALAIALPLFIVVPVFGLPAIHDITTDADDPPPFQALLALRGASASPPEYDGPDAAAKQRQAYADIEPVVLDAPAGLVFDAALAVARDRGWQVVSADREGGRIEAIDSTFWFGFKDDVVVRLRPFTAANALANTPASALSSAGRTTGTRVDVRSKSRVGVGDLGANARRIRSFVSALRARIAG